MSQIITCIIILTVLGTLFGIGFGDQNDHNNGGQYLRYARELLLSLRPRSASPQPSFAAELPPECECARNTVRRHRLRKRGRRRGVRQRFRRRSTRPPLPGVILGNVLSLRSRMDELHAIVKFLTEYRDANLLCFSEMWLDDTIASWHVHVDGFGAPVRAEQTLLNGFNARRTLNCYPFPVGLSTCHVNLAQYLPCLCICLQAHITP